MSLSSFYDEINDYNLGEFHEMNTTNNLNHEITSDTNIIDIDKSHNTDDVGYAMPSTSMRVDENINDIVRNSPTLTEDVVVPVVHCSVVTLNITGIPLSALETFAEVQTSPTYLLGGISYPNESDFQFLFSDS
jgi:hypothetical protein